MTMVPERVVVAGAGAAGFFAAIAACGHHPGAEVLLLEKSSKVLAKVRISGGGRCNVTHDAPTVGRLVKGYPRGEKFLRKAFGLFGQPDTVAWFKAHGVELRTEADGRMFPVTNDSATIAECLLRAAREAGVELRTGVGVKACRVRPGGGLVLGTDQGEVHADRLIVATGGHPKAEAYHWLRTLGHTIVPPVPSLFTFNLPDDPVRALMGVTADPVRVRITGTDLESTGPLLVTHWGMSGPAVLRLSAWGARTLHAMGHRCTIAVDWTGGQGEEAVRARLFAADPATRRKQAANANPMGLPARLWGHLLEQAGVSGEKTWDSLGRHARNRLVALLTNDRHEMNGRTTFKEEFVTAGGVDLAEVDPRTMQSRIVPGLYFAGEVLDIDGITGGFNFQAAWTTGRLAGMAAAGPTAPHPHRAHGG